MLSTLLAWVAPGIGQIWQYRGAILACLAAVLVAGGAGWVGHRIGAGSAAATIDDLRQQISERDRAAIELADAAIETARIKAAAEARRSASAQSARDRAQIKIRALDHDFKSLPPRADCGWTAEQRRLLDDERAAYLAAEADFAARVGVLLDAVPHHAAPSR